MNRRGVRVLSSTGVTRLPRSYDPLRLSDRPSSLIDDVGGGPPPAPGLPKLRRNRQAPARSTGVVSFHAYGISSLRSQLVDGPQMHATRPTGYENDSVAGRRSRFQHKAPAVNQFRRTQRRMAILISAFWLRRSSRGGRQFYCRGFASGLAIRLFARFNGCGEVVPLAAERFEQTLERVPQFGAALFEVLLACGC